MKIYLSGKITGLPLEEAISNFEKAEKQLAAEGYKPVNPMQKETVPDPETWEGHMVADIKLLFECDAIFLLSNWTNSRGAMIEKYIAEITGKTVIYQAKQEIKEKREIENKLVFMRVETAVYETTGLLLSEYALKSRKRELYYARLLFANHCRICGVKNKSLIARMIRKDASTLHRIFKRYPDEVRYNSEFRELNNQVKEKLITKLNI